ncbi:DNA translocase FtsK 4TM domain-containing protein [Helicobacter sp. 13S00482-2]|uniref:FtsK/SpoIIIE family DNA translocase n=1 Tax=Helicobacter sp. 13S00482-2 TaxID=1476200 RepID=UPI002150723A|nr:DNA translocase FtsK 4TM domain-containing protein [Helicobacter sp. 13S00482-2]
MVGKFGVFFAEKNIGIFGYLSYVYLLFLIYPAYRFYKTQELTQRRLELILGGILGFLALLVAQAMIFKKGLLGQMIVDFLHPFIGLFGIFILVFIMFFIAYMIFFQKHFMQVTYVCKLYVKKLSEFLKDFFSEDLKKYISIYNRSKDRIQKKSRSDFDTEIFDLKISAQISDLEPEKKPTSSVPDIGFDEKNIRVIYNQVIDKDNQEKKYADMVRLVGEDEQLEARKEDIKYLLDKNKKFFEQLSEEHFQEEKKQKSTHNADEILKDISKNIQIPRISPKEENQPVISDVDQDKSNVKRDLDLQIQSCFEKQSLQDFDFKESFEILESQEETQTIDFIEPDNMLTKNQNRSNRPLIVKELSENTELLKGLEFGEPEKPKDYKLPSLDLLEKPKTKSIQIDENEIDKKIQDLLAKLKMFKIDGDIARTYSGPIVTTFEFKPAANVKVSRILTLGDDLAMALKAQSIRIQAPIPGKDVVGIEIPNSKTEIIYLREILQSELFENSSSPLTLALGKDIVGNPFITDLKKLPHLLIAGTTGSGKSVGVNAMILSLLFRNSPDSLKLIMIDPKMVEFSMYSDIPHLLTPIITDPKKAISALASAVNEMERRYKIMSESKTKNIDKYNPKAKQEGLEVFPFLVIIIDELADLMMTGGKEAEFPIARIAQMGRAAGLHLIVATQRPSVDVVTGLIKTNLPSRVSFKVGSKIDSRVVLDTEGAQSLLGRGDMLFTPPGISGVVRLHAPWASEEEIEEIVEFIKSQREVQYDKNFLIQESHLIAKSIPSESGEIINEAKRIILQDRKTSISYLQRKLGVGYNKSASIIEELENEGFLSSPNSKGIREIIGI